MFTVSLARQGPLQLDPITLAAAIGVLLVFAIMSLFFLSIFRPWLQATLAGVPLTVFHVVGMRLRRVHVRTVIEALIMAHHAGCDLPVAEVERAYLKGVDVTKVAMAFVRAHKQGESLSFDQLVETELAGKSSS